MEEYDRADARFYDYYSTGVPGDVRFYVEEAKRAGSPVLELGCGTGRILIPTAQAGIDIVGLDRAPAMLAIARDKLSELGAETRRRIELVEDDADDWDEWGEYAHEFYVNRGVRAAASDDEHPGEWGPVAATRCEVEAGQSCVVRARLEKRKPTPFGGLPDYSVSYVVEVE